MLYRTIELSIDRIERVFAPHPLAPKMLYRRLTLIAGWVRNEFRDGRQSDWSSMAFRPPVFFLWKNATKKRCCRATAPAPADLEPPKGYALGLGFGLARARAGVGLVCADAQD